jgi:UDP-glucose 4-epimerase
MKYLIFTALLITAIGIEQTYAYEQSIYPTYPGTTIRDYSQPGYIQQNGNLYQTLPGTNIRDYSAPGYRIENGNMYPTLPGTNIRDYSKPGYQFRNY